MAQTRLKEMLDLLVDLLCCLKARLEMSLSAAKRIEQKILALSLNIVGEFFLEPPGFLSGNEKSLQ